MKKKGLKAFIALVLFLEMACHYSSPELPIYGKIPSFHLVNQNQQAFSSQDLHGKIWVANFIFTSCRTVCPLLTQRMKGIQDVLQKMAEQNPKIPAHLVSFSVDPERDTPEKLLTFAQKFGVDHQWWTFLTGPLDEVTQTVVQGFKISMGKVPIPTPAGKASPSEVFEIVHGEKFVLVDEQGQIRGYYDSDPSSIQRLVNDLKQLIKKAGS